MAVETVESAGRSVAERLEIFGISRRRFLQYCAGMAAVLALPAKFSLRIAHALESATRPSLIWMEFQSCTGNSESLLRSRNPSVGDLVLELVSVDYMEVIMAAAGDAAEDAKDEAIAEGGHLVVIEGSIPQAEHTCTIAGRSAREHLEHAAQGAAAIISVGTCASYGGIPAANPNPTGAVGVRDIVSGVPILSLPGCPANATNIAATLVHFLTFESLPPADRLGRPLFAYGGRIHDTCERRAHFDAGQFAIEWGDEGHRKGWCLYRLGCKGPSTFHNCGAVRWNQATSWPIGAGHPCVGCSEPAFWDTMTPFYDRLPDVPGFGALGADATATRIGLTVVGATAAGFAAHGVAKAVQRRAAKDGPPGHADAASEAEEATDEEGGS